MPNDLFIEGGTLVLPDGPRAANVLISDGRIADIGDETHAAATSLDAAGLVVVPGFVDAHVHCMELAEPEREDWAHASRAALAAGVTTVVEHTHAAPVRTADQLRDKRAALQGRATVDFALAAHAWPHHPADAVDAWHAGAAYLKVFTCTTHGVEGFDAPALAELFAALAEVGAPCLVHCEDQHVLDANEQDLRAAQRQDNGIVPRWRSQDAERVAVERVLDLAGETGANVIVAHVSSPLIIEAVRGARARGVSAAAETCPQYLTLLEREVEEHGGLRKFTPPARARDARDLSRMWELVRAGAVDYVSSDHAPATRAQKASATIWDAPFGLPGLDTTSSILIDAVCRDELDWSALVALYATTPAQLYGLAGKGVLARGRDADLAIIDPRASRTLRDADVRSKAGWTPYAGRQVRGRVVATIKTGEVVYDLARPGLAATPGRFIAGASASAADRTSASR